VAEDRISRIMKALGLGRFQVMALLQAARYYALTGDEERAKSFGLNRAIFYAWAKRRGPKRSWGVSRTRPSAERGRSEKISEPVEVGRRGYFAFGGVEQTPLDFERQVLRKLQPLIKPNEAWRAALDYVKQFPGEVLRDPQLFYKYVYEPVRDTFLRDLAKGERPKPPGWVLDRLKLFMEGGSTA